MRGAVQHQTSDRGLVLFCFPDKYEPTGRVCICYKVTRFGRSINS